MGRVRSDLQHQRGAFSILSAATLVMAILFLALVVDSGRLYLEQRKLQKIADTAALESISRLESGNCALDTANAHRYALENAASYGFAGGLTSSCASIAIIDGLRVPTVDADGRAVRVVTSNQVPASIIVRTGGLFGLPGNSTVRLQAVAVAEKDSDPMTVFSVGAQLLDLNANGVLPRLLKAAGADISGLTLLDSEGLANAQVTPGELLQALGVEVGINQLKALTPEGLAELAGTKVSAVGIQQLIDVSAKLVTHNEALAADIRALGSKLANSTLKGATVNLLGTDEVAGLLQLTAGPGQPVGSALDSKLNLGDVLSTGLMTAVQGRGLVVNPLTLLSGNGQTKGTLTIQMGIVEPPSIGIGPVGTTAFNAQTRVQLDINSNNLPILGSLLNFLGTSVHLPLILDLASAKGELIDIDCSRASPLATIEVESTIGNICIGDMANNTLWSTRTSCREQNIQETSIIKLAGMDIVHGKAFTSLLSTGINPHRDSVTLAEQESAITIGNPVLLGASLKNLMDQVIGMVKLGLPKKSNQSPGFSKEQATAVANRYLVASNYDGNEIKNRLINNGLNWSRPTLCLPIVGCLASLTMVDEWYLYKGGSGCNSNRAACLDSLATALQTEAKGGLLENILTGVSSTLKSLLNGLGLGGDNQQPLLLKIISPILTILEPVLNEAGNTLSQLLTELGLDLGKSEIKVHSISCGIPRLVQ